MYKDMYVCAFQGNVVLTDFEYTILSLLRTRTDTEDVRFAVREKYPIHSARQREPMMNQERYSTISLAPYHSRPSCISIYNSQTFFLHCLPWSSI